TQAALRSRGAITPVAGRGGEGAGSDKRAGSPARGDGTRQTPNARAGSAGLSRGCVTVKLGLRPEGLSSPRLWAQPFPLFSSGTAGTQPPPATESWKRSTKRSKSALLRPTERPLYAFEATSSLRYQCSAIHHPCRAPLARLHERGVRRMPHL